MADNSEVKATCVHFAAAWLTLGAMDTWAEGSQGLRHKLKCHTVCQWSLN